MGTIAKLGEHLAADFFWGLGTRIIFTNYTDVQNPVGQYYKRGFICGIYIPPAYNIDLTLTRFHMNAGIRLLYYL